MTRGKINYGMIIFLAAFLLLFVYLSKVFGTFGIYIHDDRIYYKTIKRKEVDINSIVGIKIIKSEGQVNIAWSSFDMKDRKEKSLYNDILIKN